jgi:hypothetical protein
MILDADWIRVIDQRIHRYFGVRDRDRGVVTSRSTLWYDDVCQVAFDIGGFSAECQIAADVDVREGDRVLVEYFDPHWVVTHSLSKHALGSAGTIYANSAGTTTSGSFVTMPGAVSVTLTKYFDDTYVWAWCFTHMWSTLASTNTILAATLVSTATGTRYEGQVCRHRWSYDSDRMIIGGFNPALVLPAGTYTLTAEWLRSDGTGVLTTDAHGWTFLGASEYVL